MRARHSLSPLIKGAPLPQSPARRQAGAKPDGTVGWSIHPRSCRGSSSNGTVNRHKGIFGLNQHLPQTSVSEWPVWMRKPLGIIAFTNLFCEESEWQSVSESLSAGAYVGFLFPCYSTPCQRRHPVRYMSKDNDILRPFENPKNRVMAMVDRIRVDSYSALRF
jgi:hypothetical protein